MNNDWTGNNKSIYVCHGASNHTEDERQAEDYYATETKATEWLLKLEKLNNNIWECACGEGHMAEPLIAAGHNVKCTDLIDRNYGQGNVDFLNQTEIFDGDIVTNPPYKYAKEFVEKALELVNDGSKVCMFLKLTFLEGKARKDLFKRCPPKTVYVSSSRLKCVKNGDFEAYGDKSTAVAYCWYVWEKGYTGETIIKWFN